MATKLTSGLIRGCTLATQWRGSNTTSGRRIHSSPIMLQGTAVVLTRFSPTELAIWGPTRPWSMRTTTLHITTIVGGWEVLTCSETPPRITCQRVSCRNSIVLGLDLVAWVEAATANVLVAATRTIDTLSSCGQIILPWDNLIRRTSGCYLNNRPKNNTRQRAPRVW